MSTPYSTRPNQYTNSPISELLDNNSDSILDSNGNNILVFWNNPATGPEPNNNIGFTPYLIRTTPN